MITEGDILDKFDRDIKNIEKEIANKDSYNKRNFIIRNLVNFGITLDGLFPYVLSASILLTAYISLNKTPFIVDMVTENGCIEVIDSSNGDHFQTPVKADEIYSSIEYSTGWQMNNIGFYERTSTTYRLNNNVDLNNVKEILEMDKSELDYIFEVTHIEVVTRARSFDLDPMYDEDIIVVTRVITTDEQVQVDESIESNVFTTVLFLFMLFILEKGISEVKKVVLYDCVIDNLQTYRNKYQQLDDRRVEELQKMLKSKKENLSLLCEGGEIRGRVKTR